MTAELWREFARLAERFAEAADAVVIEDSCPNANVQADAHSSAGTGGGSWREKLWIVPPETRLNVREVAQALGRSTSWVYKRTSRASPRQRLPHRSMDGGKLVFLAGEVRTWVRETELSKEPASVSTYLLEARRGSPRRLRESSL